MNTPTATQNGKPIPVTVNYVTEPISLTRLGLSIFTGIICIGTIFMSGYTVGYSQSMADRAKLDIAWNAKQLDELKKAMGQSK